MQLTTEGVILVLGILIITIAVVGEIHAFGGFSVNVKHPIKRTFVAIIGLLTILVGVLYKELTPYCLNKFHQFVEGIEHTGGVRGDSVSCLNPKLSVVAGSTALCPKPEPVGCPVCGTSKSSGRSAPTVVDPGNSIAIVDALDRDQLKQTSVLLVEDKYVTPIELDEAHPRRIAYVAARRGEKVRVRVIGSGVWRSDARSLTKVIDIRGTIELRSGAKYHVSDGEIREGSMPWPPEPSTRPFGSGAVREEPPY